MAPSRGQQIAYCGSGAEHKGEALSTGYASPEEFETKTKFFIETQIVPSMDELNTAMKDPARPWHKRAVDALKIVPQIGGAFLAGGGAAALTKAITATAAHFFVEVAAKGDKEEALKRSGLTYLLRLRAFHDSRS